MSNRVRIGTCSGPAEAAFVRSVFDAHELAVVINGEMHASALGGLGGFIRLDILVDSEDAEEAAALLNDIRTGEHAMAEDSEPVDAGGDAPDAAARDERADAEGVWHSKHDELAADAPGAPGTPAATPARFDTRRRRTGIALLLSVVPGFGAAHMSTGAWGRGFAITAFNIIGVAYLAPDVRACGWLLVGARLADIAGALWRVWR
jgi:hypothetical protein